MSLEVPIPETHECTFDIRMQTFEARMCIRMLIRSTCGGLYGSGSSLQLYTAAEEHACFGRHTRRTAVERSVSHANGTVYSIIMSN